MNSLNACFQTLSTPSNHRGAFAQVSEAECTSLIYTQQKLSARVDLPLRKPNKRPLTGPVQTAWEYRILRKLPILPTSTSQPRHLQVRDLKPLTPLTHLKLRAKNPKEVWFNGMANILLDCLDSLLPWPSPQSLMPGHKRSCPQGMALCLTSVD